MLSPSNFIVWILTVHRLAMDTNLKDPRAEGIPYNADENGISGRPK